MTDAPRTIDVHAHCVPVDVMDTLRADGGRYGIEVADQDGRSAALIGGRVQTRPMFPALSDLPRRLAAMDAAGVDVQVLSSWIDLTAYALEPDAGVRYARMFNEALAATAATAPDRFRTLATVPLQAPDRAAARAAARRHVAGHGRRRDRDDRRRPRARRPGAGTRSGRRPRSCARWSSCTPTRRWPGATCRATT